LPIHRIVIDGLNLGARHGTGIATYGDNLSRLLQLLRYRVDVLYDRPVSRGPDALRQEISFYANPPPRGGRFRATRLLARLGQAIPAGIAAVQGMRPANVRTDVVLQADALPHHPGGAGILTAGSVFRNASATAILLRRPLRIRLPEGAALHLTYPIPMIADGAPTIMTVHDIIPLRMPYAVVDPRLRFLKHLRIMVERVDHIIAISESTKQDLLQVMGLRSDKISVVYQPTQPPRSFDAEAAPRLVEELYGLKSGEYFLFAGAIEPKKNLPRLIEAFLMSGASIPLVIVGPDGWMVQEQLAPLARYRALKRKRRNEKIIMLGYLPANHLASLLSQARALLFPSIYEGFGLPMVEAMQLGVPVLTGSLGSLPEIAGGAALIVDPFDAKEIVQGIRQLDADADLREALRNAGRSNVARFSDQSCLSMLEAAYRTAGIGSARPADARCGKAA
jgi:glycosyltransferase involved in cell wall biosynthesis